MMDLEEAAQSFRALVAVIKRLRTPGTGCPWDLEQDHLTLRPFLIEEAFEVLDAIERGDDRAFREELGDLLLQVVLHAQVADDRGAFAITEVIRGIEQKMVRRHPHVFGSQEVEGSAEVLRNWEQIKAAELEEKGSDPSAAAALARLPLGLPALQRAHRIGEKAARQGFEASSLAALLAEIGAAFAEFEKEAKAACSGPPLSADRRALLEKEMGQLLFQLSQLARRLGFRAEDTLRGQNQRFIESFRQG